MTSFSLLFGTTWIVNALAFFGILCSVLLAILINCQFPIRRPTPFYIALFVSILRRVPDPAGVTDLRSGRGCATCVAVALAFAPIFFANLVFSYSFRETASADMAFASNLLGAVVGGALEYLALVTGYQFLLVIVAGLYGLAWLFASRVRVGLDRELSLDEHTPEEPALGQGPGIAAEPAG